MSGQDKLDLGALDAITGTGTNDGFAFIGTGAFSIRTFTGGAVPVGCDQPRSSTAVAQGSRSRQVKPPAVVVSVS